jgi:hypothetical protein
MLPGDWRLRPICDSRLSRSFREKVMVYDERDRPWCALPGVYVSMPAHYFDDRYQRAGAYFRHLPVSPPPSRPDLLFSFVGSPSSSSRSPLLRLQHPDSVIENVDGFTFYDESSRNYEARRERYREVLGRSRFVLCPRGRGTSSIRLYETLASGRVPVIISDEWVAPRGPDWDAFSIRWPEGRVSGLIEMLEERDADWPSLSAAADAAYREWFAPDIMFHRVAQMCEDLLQGDRDAFPPNGVRGLAFASAGFDGFRRRSNALARRTAKRALGRTHRA